MSNKLKKALESDLISTLEGKLADLSKAAALNTKKTIKNLSKELAKKFYKEVKKTDKKKVITKSKTKTKTSNKSRRGPGRPRKSAKS